MSDDLVTTGERWLCSVQILPAKETMPEKAKRLASKQPKASRDSANSRGYNREWRKARLDHLRRFPFCVECAKQDRYISATDVDHIIPHRGDMVLFWKRSNWQSLCKSCHSKKTASGL
jgi:5-methylcytosine-specific restriction protein A